MPIYALYALFFAETGLSEAKISVLFIIWSIVGFVAEVPAGALADRFSRKGALVASSLLQALGYVVWIQTPGFAGFAAGFVLWGLGGSLMSGSLEALLYEGLAASDEQVHYSRVYGAVTAAGLFAQLPTALSATLLFSLDGFRLAGWVSVGCCLATALVALRLPEAPRKTHVGHASEPSTYLRTLRMGLTEAVARPAIRVAIAAAAVLGGLDALEEYFSLLAKDWGVPISAIPLVLLLIPLVGAVGAALGGKIVHPRPGALAMVFGACVIALGAAGLVGHWAGIAAVAVFYGVYRLVLVVVDVRLQHQIEGPARATVTSVATLGIELTCLLVFAAWAFGGLFAVAVMSLLVAAALPRWLHHPS